MSAPLPHRLVRASAGTGKTYRLTLRYLELLLAGAAPERVLATTFTRKAAGEILDRLLLRLAAAAIDPVAAGRLASEIAGSPATSADGHRRSFGELLERVCRSLHRLQVATLDSFFHRATALFRHELGLPRFARVAAIGDPVLEPLRLRALEAALGAISADDVDTLVELLGRLYRGDAQRSVVRALDLVVLEVYEAYRCARDPAVWSTLDPGGAPLAPALLAAALDALGGVAAAVASDSLREAVRDDLEASTRGDWLDLLAGGVAEKILQDPLAPTYRRARLPPALVAAYRPVLDHAAAVLLGRIAEQTVATGHLLAAFDGPFGELRRRAGVVLYSELVDGLRALFGGDLAGGHAADDEPMLLELFYRLDGAVHHLLLDELQDTSVEQWQAIAPLVDELLAYGDGSRSVFGVGDPKQSIYGWRGGCAELFGELEARMRAGAGDVEVLSASHRSSPPVLAAVNFVFGRLTDDPALAGEPEQAAARRFVAAFDEQVSAHPERPGYVVLATSKRWEGLFEADDPPVPAGALAEAESVLEDVEAAAEPAPRPLGHLDHVAVRVRDIVERLGQGTLPGLPPSVGVLCLTNRTVRELRGRLEDLGLDASGEGAGPVDDDPAVAAVVSALHLAEHPGATASAFHVASGPLGPLVGLADWRRPDEVSGRLRRELVERGATATVARWLRGVRSACDERNARRLQQLAELLPSLLADGPGPGELARRIAGSLVEEPMPATVRVMTVHQAKGLEFDVVVLGELERRIGDLANPLVDVLRSSATGPVAAVHRATNKTIRGLSEQLLAARRQEVERRVLDDLGVLYVALTRARFELHAFVQPREKGAGGRTFASLLTGTLAAARSADATGGGVVLYEDGRPLDRETLGRHRPASSTPAARSEREELVAPPAALNAGPGASAARDLPRALASPRRGLPVLAPSELGAAREVTVAEILRAEPSAAALRGRVLHDWLSRIEWLGESTLPGEAALLRSARRLDPGASEHRLREMLAHLERLIATEPLRAILTRPAPAGAPGELEVWRERPFLAERDGTLLRGVFDRVVVHARHGRPVAAELFEWKTERSPGGLDVAGIERLRSRHQAQLEAYREAAATMLGLLPTSVAARVVYLSLPGEGSSRSAPR